MKLVKDVTEKLVGAEAGPALFFPDCQTEPVNYQTLGRLVSGVAQRLHDVGLRKGDILGVEIHHPFHHAVLLIACLQLGICTVSHPKNNVGLRKWGIKATILDNLQTLNRSSQNCILVDNSWFVPAGTVCADTLSPEILASDLCRLMQTSGTTGEPKVVALTYEMIDERLLCYASGALGTQFAAATRLMCGLQLATSLGYTFLLHMVARGGLFCMDSAKFENIVSAINSLDIDMLATTPYTLAEIIRHINENRNSSFNRLKLCLTAGSLVLPSLAGEIRKQVADEVIVFYGTTETGVVSMCSSPNVAGDVGVVVANRKVEILGPNNRCLGCREVGRIRIMRAGGGPLPFLVEHGDHSDTTRLFFEPGDVGYLEPDGRLIIVGRETSILNVGGSKIGPEVLEAVLRAAPGIDDCAVACRIDALGIGRITACIVLNRLWNERRFLDYCRSKLSQDFLPSRFIVTSRIPRTENRKVDRAAIDRLIT